MNMTSIQYRVVRRLTHSYRYRYLLRLSRALQRQPSIELDRM